MFIIVKDEYEQHLRNSDLADIVEEYVTNAPGSKSNKANTVSSPHRKFHGHTDRTLSDTETAFYADEITKADGIFRKVLLKTDKDYFDHPKSSQGGLYEYAADSLADDIFVSYKSEKYPFIDSAGFYTHVSHLPRDFDSANLKINGRDGEGHYVVMWKWRGYYDCTDVDYFSTKVENRYGVTTGEFIYSKLDHCQYQEPKDIISSCAIVPSGADASVCVDALQSKLTNNMKRKANYRIGINVVPNTNSDKNVAFDVVNIPYENKRCVNTESTLFDSLEVTHTPIAWSKFKKTVANGVVCSNVIWTEDLTFRGAVLECTAVECLGISWANEGKGFSDSTLSDNQVFSFIGCGATDTVADSSYKTILKTATHSNVPDYFSETVTKTWDIAFQRSSRPLIEGDTRVIDTGEEYSLHSENNLNYGWSCDTSSNTFMGLENANADNEFNYVKNFHLKCDDGGERIFEFAVDNGVYKVQSTHNRKNGKASVRGLTTENVKMANSNTKDREDVPLLFTRIVEVNDGRLTIQGGPGCLGKTNRKLAQIYLKHYLYLNI